MEILVVLGWSAVGAACLGLICGVGAILRWRSRCGQDLPPFTFICVSLEAIGLLILFGMTVERPSWVAWEFLPRGLVAVSIGMLAVLVLGIIELFHGQYSSGIDLSRTGGLAGTALVATSLSVALCWLTVWGGSSA